MIFPLNAQGQPDWTWFESGPPQYVVAFFAALQTRADMTLHRVELARRELRLFPPWHRRPAITLVDKDSREKKYTYDKAAWDRACSASSAGSPAGRHSPTHTCTPHAGLLASVIQTTASSL